MIQFSDATLARKLWLDQACNALLDYRSPGETVTRQEREGLANYLDVDVSPATAAELFQALVAS